MGMGDRIVARQDVAESDGEYALSRYVCDLKTIMKQMHENTLSFQEYPSVYPMPEEDMMSTVASTAATSVSTAGVASVRNTTSKYSKFRAKGAAPKNYGGGSRQLVFVIGGSCYSEL